MGKPTGVQLTSMALAVLEEVAAMGRHHAPPQTRGVALALAFLARAGSGKERWPFDEFWRAMRCECRTARPARLNAALAAIYAGLGRTRDVEVVSAFQLAANARHGAPGGFPQ